MNQAQLNQITTTMNKPPLVLAHVEWLDRMTIVNPPHPHVLIDEMMCVEFPELSSDEAWRVLWMWSETTGIRAAVWLYEWIQGLGLEG